MVQIWNSRRRSVGIRQHLRSHPFSQCLCWNTCSRLDVRRLINPISQRSKPCLPSPFRPFLATTGAYCQISTIAGCFNQVFLTESERADETILSLVQNVGSALKAFPIPAPQIPRGAGQLAQPAFWPGGVFPNRAHSDCIMSCNTFVPHVTHVRWHPPLASTASSAL